MAAKKQKSGLPIVAAMRQLVSWIFGSGRTAISTLLLVGLFVGGAWWAWTKLKDRILARPEYRIGPEQVEITPQPPWIPHTDVRAEVFRSPMLDGPLSITDDELAKRIADAFAHHAWVARAIPVTKKYGGVKVELVYRKPVCMVKLPGGGLLPVDVEGVLLPTAAGDITPSEAARYPKLWGIDGEATGPAGSRWGDARVLGGAEIAAALADKWESLRLDHIEPAAAANLHPGDALPQSTADGSAGRPSEPLFTLVTPHGSRILWGYAPGANAIGELTAAEKVARLQHYFDRYDTLEGPDGKPQQLNIRDLPPAVGP